MWLRIVATVALQDVGPSARPPAASTKGGQVRDQGVEVADVVDIRGRDMRHRRHPARIGHDVAFGPRLAAIGWVRSSFSPRASRGPTRCPPPSSAGRAVPVGAARRGGSHASDARRARSHSTKRRQHVLPERHPISRGNICHGNPPRSTNRMPLSGSNGSRRAHSASSKRGCAMRDFTKSTAQVQEIRGFETRSFSKSKLTDLVCEPAKVLSLSQYLNAYLDYAQSGTCPVVCRLVFGAC